MINHDTWEWRSPSILSRWFFPDPRSQNDLGHAQLWGFGTGPSARTIVCWKRTTVCAAVAFGFSSTQYVQGCVFWKVEHEDCWGKNVKTPWKWSALFLYVRAILLLLVYPMLPVAIQDSCRRWTAELKHQMICCNISKNTTVEPVDRIEYSIKCMSWRFQGVFLERNPIRQFPQKGMQQNMQPNNDFPYIRRYNWINYYIFRKVARLNCHNFSFQKTTNLNGQTRHPIQTWAQIGMVDAKETTPQWVINP